MFLFTKDLFPGGLFYKIKMAKNDHPCKYRWKVCPPSSSGKGRLSLKKVSKIKLEP